MVLVWERSGDTFYAEIEALAGGFRYSLIVEKMPLAGWGWSVLREVKGAWRLTQNGIAGTAQEAMREAEQATGAV